MLPIRRNCFRDAQYNNVNHVWLDMFAYENTVSFLIIGFDTLLMNELHRYIIWPCKDRLKPTTTILVSSQAERLCFKRVGVKGIILIVN